MRILLTILVSSILTGCALEDSPRRVLIIETHTTIVRDTVRIDKYFKSEELYCKCGCGTKPTDKECGAVECCWYLDCKRV